MISVLSKSQHYVWKEKGKPFGLGDLLDAKLKTACFTSSSKGPTSSQRSIEPSG